MFVLEARGTETNSANSLKVTAPPDRLMSDVGHWICAGDNSCAYQGTSDLALEPNIQFTCFFSNQEENGLPKYHSFYIMWTWMGRAISKWAKLILHNNEDVNLKKFWNFTFSLRKVLECTLPENIRKEITFQNMSHLIGVKFLRDMLLF